MKRLFASVCLLLLGGCVTYYDRGYYDDRAVYDDGAYYYPADDEYGDYYSGVDYGSYRYDDVYYGFSYGYYGVSPFWRLDRYRCGYWYWSHYGCGAYWRPYGGWSFSFGYWDPHYWGGYGHHSHYWYTGGYPSWGYGGGYRSPGHGGRDHDRGPPRHDPPLPGREPVYTPPPSDKRPDQGIGPRPRPSEPVSPPRPWSRLRPDPGGASAPGPAVKPRPDARIDHPVPSPMRSGPVREESRRAGPIGRMPGGRPPYGPDPEIGAPPASRGSSPAPSPRMTRPVPPPRMDRPAPAPRMDRPAPAPRPERAAPAPRPEVRPASQNHDSERED